MRLGCSTEVARAAVAEDKLSQAIGRGGQNVRLASKLSGWQLNVMTADQVPRRAKPSRPARASCSWTSSRSTRRSPASWSSEGFTTVEEIAYVPVGELLGGRRLRRGHRRGAARPCPRCAAQRSARGRRGTRRTQAGRRPARAGGHGRSHRLRAGRARRSHARGPGRARRSTRSPTSRTGIAEARAAALIMAAARGCRSLERGR